MINSYSFLNSKQLDNVVAMKLVWTSHLRWKTDGIFLVLFLCYFFRFLFYFLLSVNKSEALRVILSLIFFVPCHRLVQTQEIRPFFQVEYIKLYLERRIVQWQKNNTEMSKAVYFVSFVREQIFYEVKTKSRVFFSKNVGEGLP